MKYFRLLQYWVFSLFILLICTQCDQEVNSPREKNSFNEDWKFILGDSSIYDSKDFNDQTWRILSVPHDWSIEGSFSEEHPAGTAGGALPGGIAWYRKHFKLSHVDSTKLFYITFDGVYQNSEVFINGHLLGKRPNGYISFQYNLTPYLIFGQESNVIAVRVDNSEQPNSRWYSGSGIYRNVYLLETSKIHIAHWGSHISANNVSEESADLNIDLSIINTTNFNKELTIHTAIFDKSGNTVGNSETVKNIEKNKSLEFKQAIQINNPKLWSINAPNLYKAVHSIRTKDKLIDTYETTFGIRYFEFDSNKGFILNGKPIKIKGVCNHHDLGALGAALNIRAKERQLEILKEMGCNGIRTSHNPPSPELLDLCDRMGFIVQNETFDVWAKSKVEYDYSNYWDEWHHRDLADHLLRDRNHPSVFSWSIGNEIPEQWDTSGLSIAFELAAIVKKYAPQIPVTSGFNFPLPENNIIKSGVLDLIGFNYHEKTFEEFPTMFPGQKFIATETTSSLNSRGEYNMPSDSVNIWPARWDIPFYDGNPGNTCSSYDNCRAPWGSTHIESWKLIKEHDYLSGMYIWTGFDYLGEPTPYGWPSRSSYFGIIDLAGFPKDAYYMYQSEWTDKPVLHVFPHWNWKDGQNIDIWTYTNFEEVELFINNISQGKKLKKENDYHLQWNVNFEVGQLKAIGKNPDGTNKEIIINTAGKAYKLILDADRKEILADGKDLAFITATIVDESGNIVPDADNLIHFDVPESFVIAGVDNGNQSSHESFKASKRKAYNGKCLLILQGKKEKGEYQIQAKSEGMITGQVKLSLR